MFSYFSYFLDSVAGPQDRNSREVPNARQLKKEAENSGKRCHVGRG